MQHAHAADRQQHHRHPDPAEKALKHFYPQLQPGRAFKCLDCGGAQDHPGEKHAADPDQGRQYMQAINEAKRCHWGTPFCAGFISGV
ncbi:hypothetical protein D3C85_1294740 [compost metagenome]